MTCSYSTVYALALARTILLIPSGIALVVLAFVLDVSNGVRIAVGVLGGVAIVFGIYLRTHEAMVHRRSGSVFSLPNPFIHHYPRTEKDVQDGITYEIMHRPYYLLGAKEPLVAVVGSGWGFFERRNGPSGVKLFTHRMHGRVIDLTLPSYQQRWLAGSTIAEVSRSLLRENNACFFSHPTMDYISVGSWLALGNHGNAGDSGRPSSKAMTSARVVDLRTGDSFEVTEYRALRELFDGTVAGGNDHLNHAITSVVFDLRKEFMKRPADEVVLKRRIDVGGANDIDGASEWLNLGALQRVLFMGGARKYALGVRWEAVPTKCDTTFDHVDPHTCSRFCMYLQSDPCSVWCGWSREKPAWRTKVAYYESLRWVPLLYPVMMLFVVLTGHRNFEIVFRYEDGQFGPDRLAKLVSEMIALHKQIGGRSEVRYGGTGKPIFLDVVLRRDFHKVFSVLYDRLGIQTLALHPGKWDALPTGMCARAPLVELYFPSTGGVKGV